MARPGGPVYRRQRDYAYRPIRRRRRIVRTATTAPSGPDSTGTINANVANVTADIDGTASYEAKLQATVADVTADLNGTHVAPVITGTIQASVAAVTADIDGRLDQPLYPASVSGRNLLDQNGHPIQIRTISSWGLPQLLSNATLTVRLEEAAARGFNAVTVVMDGSNDYGSGWERWQNAVTNQGFYTGTPFQSTLGPAWETHIRHLMDETARLGMFVLASNYTGNGTAGSAAAMSAATDVQCRTTGQRWATFLSEWDHWILHIGADDGWTAGSLPGPRVEQFCRGIKDIRPNVLIVAEPNNGSDGLAQWPPGAFTYFTPIECVYNYGDSSADQFDATYSGDPNTGPVWDCEPPYIGAPHYPGVADPPSAAYWQEYRERHYVTVIRDGVGINNGHEDWWHDSFNTGSAGIFNFNQPTNGQYMDSPGIVDMQRGWAIWDMVNTAAWAPTTGFVTTGDGAGDTRAAEGSDGVSAVAYFPSSRTVVVNTTILNGTDCRIRWYDPTVGTYSTVAVQEVQSASRSASYPANHADGTSDFVLVAEAVPAGTIQATVADVAADLNGTHVPPAFTGALAATVADVAADLNGTAAAPVFTGKLSTATDNVAADLNGTNTTPTTTGTLQATTAPVISDIDGTNQVPTFTGVVAATTADVVADLNGTNAPPVSTGSIAATVDPVTGDLTGTVSAPGSFTGTLAATVAPALADIDGTNIIPVSTGAIATQLANVTSTLKGIYLPPGTTILGVMSISWVV